MSEDGDDLVERLHREAVQRYWAEKERGQRLVEQLHRQALEQDRAEQQRADARIDDLHREAVAQAHQQPLPLPDAPTISYTELPEAKPDSPLCTEWNFYRNEAGRLIAQGHLGRHVLIKGEQIVGIWDSYDDAMTEAYRQFFGQPFLVHQVQERERVLRCVSVHLWRNLRLPFRQAS
jgi:hypothetical protein